jgi:hypothetical protein
MLTVIVDLINIWKGDIHNLDVNFSVYFNLQYIQKAFIRFEFNSILLLSIKTPITEQYNHMKNIKRDIMISMIIKLTCNDKNL